jgi:hypothetical protein
MNLNTKIGSMEKLEAGFMYPEEEAKLTQNEILELASEIESIKERLAYTGINTDNFSFISGKMGTQRNPGARVIDIHVAPSCKDVDAYTKKLREILAYLGYSTNAIGEVTQIQFGAPR